MLTLYEIGQEMAALDDLLFEAGGELSDELVAWMQEYQLAERTKVERYCRYARNQAAEATACRDEAERLLARATASENRVKQLKEMARLYLESRGLTKVAGVTFTIALQRNGGRPPIALAVAPADLPPEYQRVTVQADLDKIRADLDVNGKLTVSFDGGETEVMLAHLGDVGTSLRIR